MNEPQKPIVGIGTTVDVSGHTGTVTAIRRSSVIVRINGHDVDVPHRVIELAAVRQQQDVDRPANQ